MSATPKPKSKSDVFAAYFAKLSPQQRATLQQLRKTIHTVAPRAVECISYGMPAFRVDGVLVAGFAAAKNHCSYFPMSGATIAAVSKALVRFETTKGSIHFPTDKPLPMALVRKLVKARMAEFTARPRKPTS